MVLIHLVERAVLDGAGTTEVGTRAVRLGDDNSVHVTAQQLEGGDAVTVTVQASVDGGAWADVLSATIGSGGTLEHTVGPLSSSRVRLVLSVPGGAGANVVSASVHTARL